MTSRLDDVAKAATGVFRKRQEQIRRDLREGGPVPPLLHHHLVRKLAEIRIRVYELVLSNPDASPEAIVAHIDGERGAKRALMRARRELNLP